MHKIFFVTIFLFISLSARENPFFPKSGEIILPFTTNQVKELEALKRATITLPDTARIINKVTVTYKNLDGSIGSRSIDINNSIDWHLPIFISQNYSQNSNHKKIAKKKSIKFKNIASIKYASFYVRGKSLKILTKDKKIRDFLLSDPHRIVIDFKRDASFRSYKFNTNVKYFKSITIGNHAGYYRVVIELDGIYTYHLNKLNNGYIISLN